VTKVEAGTKLVDTAGKTMNEIVTAVSRVSDLIADIAAASQEQSSGISQVNTAVTQMDQVVQQNASLVEESTAATEAMKEQAGTLLKLVARFRLGEEAAPATFEERPRQAIAAMPPIRVRPRAEPLRFDPAPLASAPHAGAGWKEF
jgi:methyl-accepting chemotaxis protein